MIIFLRAPPLPPPRDYHISAPLLFAAHRQPRMNNAVGRHDDGNNNVYNADSGMVLSFTFIFSCAALYRDVR